MYADTCTHVYASVVIKMIRTHSRPPILARNGLKINFVGLKNVCIFAFEFTRGWGGSPNLPTPYNLNQRFGHRDSDND